MIGRTLEYSSWLALRQTSSCRQASGSLLLKNYFLLRRKKLIEIVIYVSLDSDSRLSDKGKTSGNSLSGKEFPEGTEGLKVALTVDCVNGWPESRFRCWGCSDVLGPDIISRADPPDASIALPSQHVS